MLHEIEREFHALVGVRDGDDALLTRNLDPRRNGGLDDEVAGDIAVEQVAPRHLHLVIVGGDDQDGLALLGNGLVDGRDGAVIDAPLRQRCTAKGACRSNAHGKTGKAHAETSFLLKSGRKPFQTGTVFLTDTRRGHVPDGNMPLPRNAPNFRCETRTLTPQHPPGREEG